jgi:Tol biopolymer transport system component
MRLIAFALTLLFVQAAAEKQAVVTITNEQLRDGIVSEITWDNGVLLLQGVFADAPNSLKAHYLVIPANGATVQQRDAQTDESLRYWQMKANRLSPTGLGRITSTSDTKLPQYGIGGLDRRMYEAVEMGGTQTKSVLKLGKLTLLERHGPEPYDGETWSWSPAEMNRIAYVDAKGDLWIARADGASPRRVMKGNFTLPAWSPDGRAIAVAERKDKGRRWEISVIHLPADLR